MAEYGEATGIFIKLWRETNDTISCQTQPGDAARVQELLFDLFAQMYVIDVAVRPRNLIPAPPETPAQAPELHLVEPEVPDADMEI